MAMPSQVIDSSMMDLTIGLVAAGKVLALTARRQADYLQALGLVRIVAAAHAERLGLDLKVALFTASGTVARAEIGRLLDCLAQVLGSPKASNEEV
jgi:hypothetical protein